MKFICNNCGFSAEIPKKVELCPMCGSSNTSNIEVEKVVEIAVPEKPAVQVQPAPAVIKESSKEKEPEKEAPKPVDPAPVADKQEVRTKKITLSDEFFDKKHDQEHHEIAQLLKELGSEEDRSIKQPVSTATIKYVIIAAVVVLLLAGTLFGLSLMKKQTKDDSKEQQMAEVKAEVKADPIPEKKPESVAEKPAEPVAEKKVEPVKEEPVKEEPAKEAAVVKKEEKAPEPAVVKKEEPKPEPKVEKKKLPEKQPVQVKKQAPVQQAVKQKVVPQNGGVPNYERLLADGNRAITEKRISDAIHSFKEALSYKPTLSRAYRGLGICYASMGNAKQACDNYRKYLQYGAEAKEKAQIEALLKSCE